MWHYVKYVNYVNYVNYARLYKADSARHSARSWVGFEAFLPMDLGTYGPMERAYTTINDLEKVQTSEHEQLFSR